MREILFRGKRKDNGEWVYGIYLDSFKSSNESLRHWIIQSAGHNGGALLVYERAEITSETLGQFTGLLDKNGKKIFEGDIVKYIDKPHEWHFFITNQHNKYYGIFQKCIYRNFESVENKLGEKEYVFGDFYDTNEISEFVYVDSKRYEIIGNIHEVKE